MTEPEDPYVVPVSVDNAGSIEILQRLADLGHCPACGGPATVENGGTSLFIDHRDKTCPVLVDVAAAAERSPTGFREAR